MDKKDDDKQVRETGAETSPPAETSPASADGSNANASEGKPAEPGRTEKRATGESPAAGSRRKTGRRSGAPRKSSGSTASTGDKGSGGQKNEQGGASTTAAGPKADDKAADGGKAGGGGDDRTTASAQPASPRRRSATPWLVIAILVLFALAAAGGWQLWQFQQAIESQADRQQSSSDELARDLDRQVQRLDDELGATRSSVSDLEDRGEAIRQEVESQLQGQQDELAERQDYLDERIARIDDRLSRGEIAWKTAEIGFLLTRAQERLVISRDPDGAMLALQLADERVAALSRPHWLPLRSAISDAIAEIEATGEGDRVGQALTLRRLTDRVEDWPLADSDGEPVEDGAKASGDAASASGDEPLPADAAWYEKAWAATTGWLAGQVTVSRSDTPTRARERVATDREMRLWLTAVRESLLSRDRDALATTLDEAGDWLESHYATDADGPAKAIETLAGTRERFASRDFPSIDAVLDAWERAGAREKARGEPVDVDEEDPS